MHADHVAAEAKKERLAEAEQSRVAPEEVHAEGEDGVAQIFPVKVDAEVADVQETACGREGIEAGENDHQNANGNAYAPFFDLAGVETHTVSPDSGCESRITRRVSTVKRG